MGIGFYEETENIKCYHVKFSEVNPGLPRKRTGCGSRKLVPFPRAENLLDALLHARRPCHVDANVKFTPDGDVKVLDFGLAKAFADLGKVSLWGLLRA